MNITKNEQKIIRESLKQFLRCCPSGCPGCSELDREMFYRFCKLYEKFDLIIYPSTKHDIDERWRRFMVREINNE